MSIASEITRIKNNIQNAYTKAEEKGAKIPSVKNSDNLADCIAGIEGATSTKYGVPIDAFLGDINENGILQKPNTSYEFVATNVTALAEEVLKEGFKLDENIAKADFPDLTSIMNAYSLNTAFYQCKNLTVAKFPKLTSITGKNSCQNTFNGCTSLTTVTLDNLTTIDGYYACNGMFANCAFTQINLNNLTTINDTYACANMFSSCKGLVTVSFPKLTNIGTSNAMGSSTSGMFNYCSALMEIHFRSDVQALIESLDGYGNKFGATNATIYFDL